MMIDLDRSSRTQVEEILQRLLPGIEIRLVGSRARGTTKRYADIDLLVMCSDPLPLQLRAELGIAFDESKIPFKVELLEWPGLDPAFRARLLQESVAFVLPALPV